MDFFSGFLPRDTPVEEPKSEPGLTEIAGNLFSGLISPKAASVEETRGGGGDSSASNAGNFFSGLLSPAAAAAVEQPVPSKNFGGFFSEFMSSEKRTDEEIQPIQEISESIDRQVVQSESSLGSWMTNLIPQMGAEGVVEEVDEVEEVETRLESSDQVESNDNAAAEDRSFMQFLSEFVEGEEVVVSGSENPPEEDLNEFLGDLKEDAERDFQEISRQVTSAASDAAAVVRERATVWGGEASLWVERLRREEAERHSVGVGEDNFPRSSLESLKAVESHRSEPRILEEHANRPSLSVSIGEISSITSLNFETLIVSKQTTDSPPINQRPDQYPASDNINLEKTNDVVSTPLEPVKTMTDVQAASTEMVKISKVLVDDRIELKITDISADKLENQISGFEEVDSKLLVTDGMVPKFAAEPPGEIPTTESPRSPSALLLLQQAAEDEMVSESGESIDRGTGLDEELLLQKDEPTLRDLDLPSSISPENLPVDEDTTTDSIVAALSGSRPNVETSSSSLVALTNFFSLGTRKEEISMSDQKFQEPLPTLEQESVKVGSLSEPAPPLEMRTFQSIISPIVQPLTFKSSEAQWESVQFTLMSKMHSNVGPLRKVALESKRWTETEIPGRRQSEMVETGLVNISKKSIILRSSDSLNFEVPVIVKEDVGVSVKMIDSKKAINSIEDTNMVIVEPDTYNKKTQNLKELKTQRTQVAHSTHPQVFAPWEGIAHKLGTNFQVANSSCDCPVHKHGVRIASPTTTHD